MEIGQIFHNKYIFDLKKKAFQVEIWKMVWTVSKYPVWMTHKPKNPKKFPVSCRIYSIKRRGVYFIFIVSDAAFIQGRRLFRNHFS